MYRIYLISDQSGYHAFEDYYYNLKKTLKHLTHWKIKIIVYQHDLVIPKPKPIQSASSSSSYPIYIFMNHLPPFFEQMWINKNQSQYHCQMYLINTEQLTRSSCSQRILFYLDQGLLIYDYDLFQTKMINQQIISKPTSAPSSTPSPIPRCREQVYYLPYQIRSREIKYLQTLIKQNKQIYDVGFCATNQSQRRLNIYHQLKQNGVKVIDIYGWKENRDRLISQCKILINIHYDQDYQIFEHFRCDRWILAGMLVVSETSLSDSLLDCTDLLIIVPYQQIVNKIIEILQNYDHYYQQYLNRLHSIKKQLILKRQGCCFQLIQQIISNTKI